MYQHLCVVDLAGVVHNVESTTVWRKDGDPEEEQGPTGSRCFKVRAFCGMVPRTQIVAYDATLYPSCIRCIARGRRF